MNEKVSVNLRIGSILTYFNADISPENMQTYLMQMQEQAQTYRLSTQIPSGRLLLDLSIDIMHDALTKIGRY